MAPTFTLTLNRLPDGTGSNWTLACSDPAPDLFPIVSMVPFKVPAAERWGADMIERNTPYNVTGWAESQEDILTAEMKRIRHDFRVAWTDDEVATVYAKNADDAAQVRERVLRGDRFVELILGGDPVLINLAHVGTLIYRPTEVDL